MTKTSLLHLQSPHLKLRKKKIEIIWLLTSQVVCVSGCMWILETYEWCTHLTICSKRIQNTKETRQNQPWKGVFVSLSDAGPNCVMPNHDLALVSILVQFWQWSGSLIFVAFGANHCHGYGRHWFYFVLFANEFPDRSLLTNILNILK